MEYDTAEYKKLQIRSYAPRALRETSEGKFWKRFKSPVVAKQVRAPLNIATVAIAGSRVRPQTCAAMTLCGQALAWRAMHRRRARPHLPLPPQFGAVSHIDFSQQAPYHFAITASTRVSRGTLCVLPAVALPCPALPASHCAAPASPYAAPL